MNLYEKLAQLETPQYQHVDPQFKLESILLLIRSRSVWGADDPSPVGVSLSRRLALSEALGEVKEIPNKPSSSGEK